MPRSTKLDQKREEIKHLDEATQTIILRIDKNDRRLRFSAYIFMSILLIVGIIGIFYQNHLATQNKNHIDCIIKDLATPQKPGTQHKYIDSLNGLEACNIKFTQ